MSDEKDKMGLMDEALAALIEKSKEHDAQVFVTYFLPNDPAGTSRMATNFSSAGMVSLISALTGSLGLDEKAMKAVSTALMEGLERKILKGPALEIVQR